MSEHGWTRHGHRCCDQATDPRPPRGVAKCGGPGLCGNCYADAAIRHSPGSGTFAAPTSPSEPVPSTPRVPGSTEGVRQEWRVSGVADDAIHGKGHNWERIYEERALADEHIEWLSRAYPEATAKLHRRTIATFTGEWVETNDAD